jgi:menaquinol-cytochrome c reductase iron-sulfur subunit
MQSSKDRRGFFLKALAIALAAACYAVPGLAALVAALSPWRQKGCGGQTIRVASLDSLAVGGPPQRFPVIADRRDAWNCFPSDVIGAVFLRRTGTQEVEALQVICPHAGCFVGYDPATGGFFCPCHAARFDAAGRRTDDQSMSPRDMDHLAVELRGAQVWVKFEKFKTGTSSKIASA